MKMFNKKLFLLFLLFSFLSFYTSAEDKKAEEKTKIAKKEDVKKDQKGPAPSREVGIPPMDRSIKGRDFSGRKKTSPSRRPKPPAKAKSPKKEEKKIEKKQEEKTKESSEKTKTKSLSKRTYKKGDQVFVDSFDFSNAEIEEVIKSISKITKLNFIYEQKDIKGKVTIIGPKGISVNEAYRAFISALEAAGLTTVHDGKFIKIIKKRDAKGEPIPTYISSKPFSDSYVTRLIPVKYIKAQEISTVIKKLISKEADVIVYNPTNTIIITESKANLRKVLRIIEKLDVAGYEERLEVIPIKHASVNEIAEKLKSIFTRDTKKKGRPSKKAGDEDVTEPIGDIIPYERTNSLIVLATDAGIRRIKDVINKLDVLPETGVTGGLFHVHRLEHADAESLADTLSKLVQATTSSRSRSRPSGGKPSVSQVKEFEGNVKIVADAATNSLVITATPSDYKTITQIVNKLDIRRNQVFVESVVMEIQLSKGYQVGGLAGNAAQSWGGRTLFGSTFGGFTSGIQDPLTLTGFALGYFHDTTATIEVAGGTDISVPVIGALIRAAGSNSNINLLSTPHILTTDNEEATINVGQNVPFITSTARDSNMNPIVNVTRQDVSLLLKITPQISSGNYVTLKVEEQLQDLVPGQDAATVQMMGPTTSKREAKTTVVVKDQQTVVIGGLIGDKETKSISKVPILGDIPILGWLFRNTTKLKVKTNLLLFLTPYIIKDTGDMKSVFFKKVQERRRFMDKHGFEEKEDFKLSDFELNPTPEVPPEEAPAVEEKKEQIEKEEKKEEEKEETEKAEKKEVLMEEKSDKIM